MVRNNTGKDNAENKEADRTGIAMRLVRLFIYVGFPERTA